MADRRLQVFYAVARQGSFTRASEALLMTQPAVTFQIKQLEEEFNCRLIDRQHQRIALTLAGQLVFDYAEKILALSEEMVGRVADLTGEIGGHLVVGASTTLGESVLPALLGDFNAEHPQVHLQLCIGNSDLIQNRVLDGSVDVGFLSGLVQESNAVAETVSVEPLWVVCDSKHPLAGLPSVKPGELLDYEYISREPGSGTRQVINAYFRANGASPDALKVLMELGSPGAVKDVVIRGLGFAIMSGFSVSAEIARGELVKLPLNPVLSRELRMVMPKGRFRSRTISAFIDFVKRRLRAAVP